MRCYYEVLGVSRDVEATELKKAYYKMSLQWHPDKNSTKEGDTTKIFQEIQEAYRVLSDPHERAWYDSHRTQILRSGNHHAPTGVQSQFEEERLDVFQYFTRSCFNGFDDSAEGFYTVYRKVFEQIAEEEIRAAADNPDYSPPTSDDDGDDGPVHGQKPGQPYPTFGSSTSSYTNVVSPFYQFWEMFQTRKSYTWVDKYDIRCADSRQERRAMEVENRRLRNAARKKRSEEIRELVSFVKKRDKRVAAERERIQTVNQEAQARSQEISKQTRLRDATELANAWLEEQQLGGLSAQWTQDFEAELARMEAELDGLTSPVTNEKQSDAASGDSSDFDLEDAEQLYCVACDKAFSSFKAKQNHEASKKHRKQVELLRQVLLDEEGQAEQPCDYHESDENVLPVEQVKLTKRAKKAQRKRLREAEKQTNLTVDTDGENADSVPTSNDMKESENSTEKPQNINTQQQQKAPVLMCETCHEEFPSRNKLFAHLKESNHAAMKVVTNPKKVKTRKKTTP